MPKSQQPDSLRICLLSYRSNPYSGGQGVYIRYLSRSLRDLGHKVDVISGQPYPELDDGVSLFRLPSLDLYSEPVFSRIIPKPPKFASFTNLREWIGVCTGGFPEPFTFGRRAYEFLSSRVRQYDVVHDNQSLAYGLIKIQNLGVPIVATVHHPITLDRDITMEVATSWRQRMGIRRWYSFLGMQGKVARRLSHIITVSESARTEIANAFQISRDKLHVVYNGIDTEFFTPLDGVNRSANRLLVVNSGDMPLKGLHHLLEAVASLRLQRDIELVVLGSPRENSPTERLINKLGIDDCVKFTGPTESTALVRQYALATVVVVPSIYEGFGLPAAEAMACGAPVIATTGGALPEVVGDAGILVPPANPQALAEAISGLLHNPEELRRFGELGRKRILRMFSWQDAARHTVEVYREANSDSKLQEN